MTKREKKRYKVQDTYDYLLENYGLEWKLLMISDEDMYRCIRKTDFKSDKLDTLAVLWQGGKSKVVWLNVSNYDLTVSGYQPVNQKMLKITFMKNMD